MARVRGGPVNIGSLPTSLICSSADQKLAMGLAYDAHTHPPISFFANHAPQVGPAGDPPAAVIPAWAACRGARLGFFGTRPDGGSYVGFDGC